LKKSNFSLLLLIFCFATSYAQVGLRAGLNLANITGDTDFLGDNLQSAKGLQLGITYSIGLNDKLSIRPGAVYSVKGYRDNGDDTKFKTVFNYLEIPIDIVLGVYDSEAFGIDLHAGPYLGYILSGYFEEDGDREDLDFSEENNQGVARNDFGLNLGLTLNFSGVFAGINYGLGLGNLVDEGDNNINATLKNINVSIIAGYMFGGGFVAK